MTRIRETEKAREAVLLLDDQWRLAGFNSAAGKLLGPGAKLANGQPLSGVRPGWDDLVQRLQESRETQAKITIDKGDAEGGRLAISLSALCDKDGSPTNWVLVVRELGEVGGTHESIHQKITALEDENGENGENITLLLDKQRRESTLAKLTADLNLACSTLDVLKALRRALHDLGYKYLSIYKRSNGRLFWNLAAFELPEWLMLEAPRKISAYLENRPFEIWAPLDTENIYSLCCINQKPQITTDDMAILECLHVGNTPFSDLPRWMQTAALQLIDRLDVREHNAFPLGEYGILFLSNPKGTDCEERKEWVPLILEQAQVALDRVQVMDALLESEERYRALFERTNDAVFIISLDLVHLAVNQQAADMLGYSVEELVGMPIQHVIASEEWPDTKAREATLRKSDIPPIYRRTFIKKDGSRVATEVSVATVYDAQGNPTHIQSIARDITERENIQKKLRLQATALESAANGILITDIEGTILWVNPAVTKLTGYSEEELIGENPRLFKSGRQDLTIYRDLWETILSGEVWQGEMINRRKDGSLYTGELTITPVSSSDGENDRFISIMSDVSGRAQAKIILEHLATHDPLTNLPNRSLFSDRLNHALRQAKRSGSKLAVLFMDLDDFKTVNDALGHEVGDLLLQSVGEQLSNCVRESDTVARLGGDEFTVLLENLSVRQGAAIVAENVQAALSTPASIKGNEIVLSCSIGISCYPEDSANADELMRFADQAMYSVKQAGKKGYGFYGAE